MLYIIGLGLGDEKDITLRGLEAIKRCTKVYMDAYTSVLSFGSPDGLSALEELYGKQITVCNTTTDDMLLEAKDSDVAFLIVGVPFESTTHPDLGVRAKELGVDVKFVQNASIMTAIGVSGIDLHRFGATVHIPFFTDTWRPDDFLEKILRNDSLGLHTLCLLDIQMKEPSPEASGSGERLYDPPRFMTINTAIEQMLQLQKDPKRNLLLLEIRTCIGFGRLGCEDQKIVVGSMEKLVDIDFGPPPHCLVFVSGEYTDEYAVLQNYTV